MRSSPQCHGGTRLHRYGRLDRHSERARRGAQTVCGREFISRYDGCKIWTIGDSMVVAFRSAVNAVELATGYVRDTGSHELGIRAARSTPRVTTSTDS